MKRFLKLLVMVLCLSMFMPSTVLNFGVERAESAQKIKLNYVKKTIYEGDIFKLKVSGTKKKVKWTSSNKKVATVSSKGVVKGKSGGEDKKICKITAAVGGKKYVCKVTVKALPEEEDDEKDDVEEDDSSIGSDPGPTNDVAKNISALKEYIQRNGEEENDSSKGLYGPVSTFLSHIAYEKDTDSLVFSMIGGDEISTFIYMEINSPDNSSPINVSFLCRGDGFSFIADSTIIPSKYSPDQVYHFAFRENSSPLFEGDIQELANSSLKLAFWEWDFILDTYTDFTISDLGFTSFK